MRVVTSVGTMQRLAKRWRRDGVKVGLVPTMGYLHAGHLSLVEAARRRVRKSGRVVLSIYVNPTQFAPHEDLARYPRDLEGDLAQCRTAGVDVVFAPRDDEMYPPGPAAPYSTYVVEEAASQGLEGASRPTHFRGVTTIVAKLFNLVLPDVAVFGAKDYQQAAVVRRMVRDLNFPLEIIVAPTVRESDGLALSSRNKYLDADERRQATMLWQAIQEARAAVRASPGGLSAKRLEARLRKHMASHEPDPLSPSLSPARSGGEGARRAGEGDDQRFMATEQVCKEQGALPDPARQEPRPTDRSAIRVDYVAFFDPHTLQPVKRVTRGTHLALAVRVGRTRLIDNARLD